MEWPVMWEGEHRRLHALVVSSVKYFSMAVALALFLPGGFPALGVDRIPLLAGFWTFSSLAGDVAMIGGQVGGADTRGVWMASEPRGQMEAGRRVNADATSHSSFQLLSTM